MFDSNRMAVLASKTRTQLTVTPVAGAGIQQLLKPDPRRWFVMFEGFAGLGTNPKVYPGGVPDGVLAVIQAAEVQKYEWPKHPSIVVGDWFGFNDGTIQWLITECLATE